MMTFPDFTNRLLKALFCQGEPDRVPLVEAGIAQPIKERFLGRPIRSVDDEIEFWRLAGFDYAPLEAGLRTIIDAAIHHAQTGRFEDSTHRSNRVEAAKAFAVQKLAAYSLTTVQADGTKRNWAPEGKGFITCHDDLEDFPWPHPDDLDYEKFHKFRARLPKTMGILCFSGAIFSSLMLMMGMEFCMISMLEGSELFRRLLQKVGEFQVNVIEILVEKGCVDGVWINDDMGFRTGTLVNPNLFRKYIFPYYREIKTLTARHGLPLMLHSDGNITRILPDLVEIGFNAIHPFEPEAMNIHQCRELLGKDVCIIGNLSLGYPLGSGTPQDVSKETRILIQKLAPGGSYCLSSGNSIPEYIPYENWLAMRNTALEAGRYPIQ